MTDALTPRHEAPAEGAEEVMDAGFEAWLNERNLLPNGAWDWPSIVAMLNHHEDALRARSSAPEAPAEGAGEFRNASDQIISDAMENGSLYVDHDNECIAWNGPGFAATVIGALKDCGFHVVSGHNFAQGEALATREEATVGAGEWTVGQRFPELNEHLTRMSLTGNTGSRTEWVAFRDCLRSALRARSSAPEAREGEAVAWIATDSDGNEHSTLRRNTMEDWLRVGRKVTPLYTHPAAPSADKLRTALSEIRDGMVASRDCISVDDWIELADEALSTLDALKGDAK